MVDSLTLNPPYNFFRKLTLFLHLLHNRKLQSSLSLYFLIPEQYFSHLSKACSALVFGKARPLVQASAS